VVAVPIGNPKDITLRALEVLKTVDAVICEEQREGSTLLKRLGIENKLILLNEHNEEEQSMNILVLLQQGQSLALVSDCGTPVFADPGQALVNLLTSSNIPVTPVPGPSSLMAALSVVDFPLKRFIFGGFLPPKDEARRRALEHLRSAGVPVIVMDTPYRLTALLNDVLTVFGPGARLTLACDLTMNNEHVFRGPAAQVVKAVSGKKAEFILIIEPHGSKSTW
jgi:16S rRNA (cytidine1402-2'-O)-methyltransferase